MTGGIERKARPVSELATTRILIEISVERDVQDAKWGEQNHPLLTPNCPEDSRRFYYEESILWKKANADRVEAGTLAWDGILLEEVNEALGEESFIQRRQELIQAAAVIVAMIEHMDREAAKAVLRDQ